MKERLEQLFECKVKISECKSKLPLPIFMTMRDINQLELCGVRFAVVNIKNETELTVAAMKKHELDVKYTRMDGVGHNVWDYAYNKELYDWFMSKRRKL